MNVEGADEVAADLTRAAETIPQRAGAVVGKGADRIRDAARAMAQSKGWSSQTVDGIIARREASGPPTGYAMHTTEAGFYQEVGTIRHGPNPVLEPAFGQVAPSVMTELEDTAGDI